MANLQQKKRAFSLLELMAAMSIMVILAVVAIPAYRTYTVRAAIASLIPMAESAKNDVEAAHNQGTVIGTSGSVNYLSGSDPAYGLSTLTRENYGCVKIGINLGGLGLDTTGGKTLALYECPYLDNGAVEWRCGYDSASYSGYLTYLPANCQTVNTSIQTTTF
ncbi:MAG TPA: prepilin-type N-terminal cleavage/methylation domain-containing protein [Gammaproteobacteria bacterium]|nr:prepilin-type N-terminal cleavage/methylation domain-containing protein [Gammaproteobacteria bacterium]